MTPKDDAAPGSSAYPDENAVEPVTPIPGTEVDEVPATAAARARVVRPQRKSVATGRDAGRAGSGSRTTPARFVAESAEELRKVVWPTGLQVRQLYWAVLVLVLFVITFVGLLDLLFGWALLQLFG